MEEFVPEEVSMKAQFSVRIGFKLTGLPDIKKVMEFMKSSLENHDLVYNK